MSSFINFVGIRISDFPQNLKSLEETKPSKEQIMTEIKMKINDKTFTVKESSETILYSVLFGLSNMTNDFYKI